MAVVSPVVFVVFNRPEHTRKSFARIREQRPGRLFLVADGPRAGHSTDPERCQEVRLIVDDIGWDCDVHRNYADINLGCKRRVSSGLDWVFSQVDRAIVLEDDCVAHADFFGFCDALLDRYADDPTIALVTGNNFQKGVRRGDGSYYFSKYNHCWGWATWKPSWDNYDGSIPFWRKWRRSKRWRELNDDPIERRYWQRIFRRVSRDEIDSWAYPWLACIWYAGGLTATPNVNLVSNIGYGPDATHTKEKADKLALPAYPLGMLEHPTTIRQDVAADRFVFEYNFGGAHFRARRLPLGFLRWLIAGAFRRLCRVIHQRGRSSLAGGVG